MKKSLSVISVLVLLALVGCNLPGGGGTTAPDDPGAAFTQAALSMSATLTALAQNNVQPPVTVPTDTPSPTITNTPNYTPTFTTLPCNAAQFILDVTYPDNTVVPASTNFTKIWRLKNVGTCTWTSSYLVSFESNAGMGKSAGYTQSLGATVPPNQTVDISVDLTAPAANGVYTGNWALRDAENKTFPGSSFIVVIVVSTPVTVTLNPLSGESGTIRQTDGPWPDFTVGESNADITKTVETFLSYDITGIPLNATITDVKLDFRTYTVTGNPFGLGPLAAYATDYGLTLEAADFVTGFPGGSVADWSSTTALNNLESSSELKTYLQSKIGTGRLQIRLQYAGSNGDGTKDRLTFTNPTVIVTYTKP